MTNSQAFKLFGEIFFGLLSAGILLLLGLPLVLSLILGAGVFVGTDIFLSKSRQQLLLDSTSSQTRRRLAEAEEQLNLMRGSYNRLASPDHSQTATVFAGIINQAELVLEKIRNGSLPNVAQVENLLKQFAPYLDGYSRLLIGEVTVRTSKERTELIEEAKELLPQLLTALQNLAAGIDQPEVFQLKTSTKTLQLLLASDGLGNSGENT